MYVGEENEQNSDTNYVPRFFYWFDSQEWVEQRRSINSIENVPWKLNRQVESFGIKIYLA